MSLLRDLFKRLLARDLFVLLLLMGVTLAIYAPALNGQLIWDDSYLVGENPLFRSPAFCLEVFRHNLYIDSLVPYYRPVQNLSYILDYWLWRGNPCGYHLSNILFHGGSAFLLFLLLKRILPDMVTSEPRSRMSALEVDGVALCLALLWAVHPIHNAAVAYISGRADSLIAFFALIAWLLFLKAQKAPRWAAWILCGIAVLASLMALCSKEAALLWLALFLVWASRNAWAQRNQTPPQGSFISRLGGLLGACLLILLIYGWLRHLPGSESPSDHPAAPIAYRIFLACKAMWEYTGLIFWPAELHMERILDRRVPFADWSALVWNLVHDPKALLGGISLAVMVAGMFLQRPGQKLRIFGAIWFLIGFIPISNLVPLNAQAAEHWIYMPSIGFLVFLAGIYLLLPWNGSLGPALVLTSTLFLGIRTSYRSADWADPQKFFRQTEESGGRTSRVYLNLSSIAAAQGDLQLAERMLRSTHERFPKDLFAQINLGINLLSQKDPAKEPEAERLLTLDSETLRRANKEFPYGWTAPLNLAKLRIMHKRTPEAIAILEEARGVYPTIWELVACKAQILHQTQDLPGAIDEIERYANARWWDVRPWMMLADFRAANGDQVGAVDAWRHAAHLDIYNSRPFVQMARYWSAKEQFQAALDAQSKAIARAPDEPSNYLLLSAILDRLGRKQDSQEAMLRAEQLRHEASN